MISPPSLPTLAGQRVLVQGLGRFGGGVGVARWLVGQGARVTVTDTATAEELAESLARLDDLKGQIAFKLGGHDLADFASCDLLVTNPAVDKARSEHVQAAKNAGVPITTEMNLFLERCPALSVGITGAVGKSTTTTLIHLALQAGLAGAARGSDSPSVFLGGNIGKSLLADLPRITAQDIVVLELSSFMLEDTPAIGWSPNIAVVTNLFANHLDRHNTLEEYAAAKQNILRFQGPQDVAILNADHAAVAAWAPLAKGKLRTFTTANLPTIDMLMPGMHNQSNARAALATLDALTERLGRPLNRAAALAAIAGFPGLAHRLQLVHTSTRLGPAPVRWYNDSKATTPEASLTALEAFEPGSAIFIVGGYDKHSDMAAFTGMLARRAAGVLGIGQTGAGLIGQVRAENPLAGDKVVYAETLPQAVATAAQWAATAASAGSTPRAIVLSPACASWGQFANYEKRGELFAQLAAVHL